MKKKIINGFLMVAMLFATSTAFVSCKDNVDDQTDDIYALLVKQRSELVAQLNDLQTKIDNIKPEIKNYYEEVIKNYYQADLTEVNNKIDNLQSQIDEINRELTLIDEQINTLSINLDNAVNDINERLDDLESRINALEDAIQGLADLFGKDFIKNVTVNGAVNNVFGSLNNKNVLIAFYGENQGIEQFPYVGLENNVGQYKFACYLEPEDIADDIEYVYFDDYVTSSEGNAGKLYFTVDNTDYTSFNINEFDLSLENSKGEKAPVQLTNVRRSNKALTWGIVREPIYTTPLDAEVADNGFYEADATILPEDLENTTFDYISYVAAGTGTQLKALVQDIKNRNNAGDGEKHDIAHAASLAYNLVQALFLNRWTIEEGNPAFYPQRLVFSQTEDGVTVRKGQTGEINILTAAVKPLSYNTFWSYENNHDDNVYTVDVFQKIVSLIAGKIEQKFPNDPVDVEIVSVDVAGKTVTVRVNGTVETIDIEKTSWAQALQDEIDANGGTAKVNGMIKNLLSTFTLGKAAGKASNRIYNYLEKFSDYIIDEIKYHALTRALAPVILFESGYGVDRVYEGMKIQHGIMHAYLTSPTLEYLAPAYKKYIAVKKDGVILQSAVLDGSVQAYDIDLTENGKYQIILSCVDYFGYVITKKYDIRVKN